MLALIRRMLLRVVVRTGSTVVMVTNGPAATIGDIVEVRLALPVGLCT